MPFVKPLREKLAVLKAEFNAKLTTRAMYEDLCRKEIASYGNNPFEVIVDSVEQVHPRSRQMSLGMTKQPSLRQVTESISQMGILGSPVANGNIIIIDCGSHQTKAGFSEETTPSLTFPTMVALSETIEEDVSENLCQYIQSSHLFYTCFAVILFSGHTELFRRRKGTAAATAECTLPLWHCQ